MKNKSLYLFFLFVLNTTLISAQGIVNTTTQGFFYKLSEVNNNEKYESTDGTPYTNLNFQAAIYKKTNETFNIRYDAYMGVLQFKNKEGNIRSLSPKLGHRFELLDKKQSYIAVNYPQNNLGFGLLVWENENGVRLVKQQVIRYNKGRSSDGSYAVSVPASFSKVQSNYFVQLGEHKDLIALPKKKKDLYKLFGEDTKVIIKENNLQMKEEKDIVRFLELTTKP